MDLDTTFLGLSLTSPVVVSAGPVTRTKDELRALTDAGAAAIVLPSLFAEDVLDAEAASWEATEPGADPMSIALDPALRRLEAAKAAVDVPVMASVNGSRFGAWVPAAARLADAGADAIELNLFAVPADPSRSSGDVEAEHMALVGAVADSLPVPLAVKVTPFYTSFAHVARQIAEAGAAGIVCFNRSFAADVDIDSRARRPDRVSSRSDELRLPMRWIGILRAQLPALGLAASTGVHDAADVVKAILVGADVACTTSAVMSEGPQAIARMVDGLSGWLDDQGITLAEARGSLSVDAIADPEVWEREAYRRLLTS